MQKGKKEMKGKNHAKGEGKFTGEFTWREREQGTKLGGKNGENFMQREGDDRT